MDTPDIARIRSTLRAASDAMNAALVGRADEVHLCLLALIAGESVLLVGPPGVAKSALAAALSKLLDGGDPFLCAVNKFSVPEDVFGPWDVEACLKNNRRHDTATYLPEAVVAVFDEVFNGNSAFLNALLMVLNERRFRNGRERLSLPLRLFIGTSNRYPNLEEGQEELGAFCDRFLVRRAVRDLDTFSERRILLWGHAPAAARLDSPDAPVRRTPDFVPRIERTLSAADLDAARAAAASLPFSARAANALEEIVTDLQGAQITVSARRLAKSPLIAQAAAFLDGATTVEPAHLESLGAVLWTDPATADEAASVIAKRACPDGAEAARILGDCEAIYPLFCGGNEVKLAEGRVKLAAQLERLRKLDQTVGRVVRARARVEELHRQLGHLLKRPPAAVAHPFA